jgi:glycosyltransferase involved in cell wall biosynthesis
LATLSIFYFQNKQIRHMPRNIFFASIQILAFLLVKSLHFISWLSQCRRWQPWLAGNKASVLYLDPFFPGNAGFQWRTAKWREELKAAGVKAVIKIVISSFPDENENKKTDKILIHFLVKRIFHCLWALRFQTVIVRRELLLFNDYGNLFMEKFLLGIHPNVILDFDDDIAASKREPRPLTSWYGRLMLENGNKFNDSLRLYKRFIVASNYLKEKVLKENPKVHPSNILVMPTCVDYDRYEPKVYDPQKESITFGWIGGNQNQPYLQEIIPALNEVAKENAIELIVISGKAFRAETSFPIHNIPWSLETEVEQLKKIDVGLMPLPLNERTKGKGGFKLIQYMGLGIVSMASAITINKEIVDDGDNGFLVEPGGEWAQAFRNVIRQRGKFPTFGAKAREKIMEHYTFSANKERMMKFILQGHES